MSLAGLAAHLPEIWPAAELEPEHQGAVGHGVHIFALCQEEDTHGNEMFMVVFIMDVLQELDIRLAIWRGVVPHRPLEVLQPQNPIRPKKHFSHRAQ